MATTKTITAIAADTTSKQFAPESANSDVLTDGVYRNLIGLDWGQPERANWQEFRPLLDGAVYRGGVYQPREVVWTVGSYVNPSAVTATATVERIRDDEESALLSFFNETNAPFKLQQARTDSGGNAITRYIRGYPMALPSWRWTPDDYDEGFVGRYDNPHLVKPFTFWCPFPWFQDSVSTSSGAQTLDGTLRTVAVNNTGHTRCGIKITMTGSSGSNLTVTISSNIAAIGSGITISGITISATPIVIDCYATDPTAYTAVQSTTNLRSKLSAGSILILERGSNTISWQVTSGSPTGGQITFEIFKLWGSP